MQRIQIRKSWVVIICVCLVILYITTCGNPISEVKKLIFKDSEGLELENVISKLHIPSKNCSGLVDDWSKYNMSEEYFRLLPSFTSRLKEAAKSSPESEGHSGQLPVMTRTLHYLASSASVKVVCETGFNYGHSSFNFLTANENIKVHSFDIGQHDYAKKMAEVLKDMFKERIEVHFGDSTKTVPENKANGVLPLCDLIFVDGGHIYPVAKADLLNFGTHSNPENVVIFDDYPTGWGASFGKAWEELLVRGEDRTKVKPLDAKSMKDKSPEALSQMLGIVEQMRCTVDSTGLERAFTFGKYVSRG